MCDQGVTERKSAVERAARVRRPGVAGSHRLRCEPTTHILPSLLMPLYANRCESMRRCANRSARMRNHANRRATVRTSVASPQLGEPWLGKSVVPELTYVTSGVVWLRQALQSVRGGEDRDAVVLV